MRRRYVAFEVCDGKLDVYKAAASMRKKLGGDQTGVRVILYDRDTGSGLICCAHSMVSQLKRIVLQSRIPIKILGVSGTIKSARRKFLAQPEEPQQGRNL